jgi:rRNA-processing protein FCF1
LAVLKIVADTSFLMIPGLFRVDIFAELNRILQRRYEILVPEPVVKELEYLSRRGTPSERSAARLALSALDQMKILPSSSESADLTILEVARKHPEYLVATADYLLQKRLQKLGVNIIRLRQRTHLMLEREIE